MKSHIIIKDKKITMYMGIMLALLIYMFVHTAGRGYSNFGIVGNILDIVGSENAKLLIAVGGIALIFLLMSQLITFVFTDEDKIRKGLLFPRIVYYSEIESIEIDERSIIIKYTEKVMKISTHGFENNQEKFADMINDITNGAKTDKTSEHLMDEMQTKQNAKYQGEPMKLGGWLIAILSYYIFSAWFTILPLLRYFSFRSVYEQLTALVLISVHLLIMYAIVSRTKKAVKSLTIYLWIDFALKCLFTLASGLIPLIFMRSYVGLSDYLDLAVASAAQVMFVLSITRYMTISRRVQMTFLK